MICLICSMCTVTLLSKSLKGDCTAVHIAEGL